MIPRLLCPLNKYQGLATSLQVQPFTYGKIVSPGSSKGSPAQYDQMNKSKRTPKTMMKIDNDLKRIADPEVSRTKWARYKEKTGRILAVVLAIFVVLLVLYGVYMVIF